MKKDLFIKNYVLNYGNNNKEKSSNLYITRDNELINYNTRIAYFNDDLLMINDCYYSNTTSRNQNLLKKYARLYNIDFRLYTPFDERRG